MVQSRLSSDIVTNGGFYEQFDFEADGATSSVTYTYPIKIDCTRVRTGVIISKNTHASNSIYYKIIGSNASSPPLDDTDISWATVKAETSIASLSETIDAYSNVYKWIWVGIKNNSGAGTYKGWHRGTN